MSTSDKIKIVYVTPHLSTGGLPQYLTKKIELFSKSSDVYCVEYSFLGSDFVVQRNRIIEILGERFFSLDNDKSRLVEIISKLDPHVVHFEELPETFVDLNILKKIYHPDRKYFICETCHSSTYEPSIKTFKPDKFIMVNRWIEEKFKILDIPSEILEYPIEHKKIDKRASLEKIGLNPEIKHVVNIGLFTPGKNQGELFEYARSLEKLPIEFHFVGNQAPNFESYWSELMKEIPTNCRIWGERSDVELFYQAADLFVFTSKLELNPLVIKESLSFKLPCMIYDLHTYKDEYKNNPLVSFLTPDMEKNTFKILEILGFVKKIKKNYDNPRIVNFNL